MYGSDKMDHDACMVIEDEVDDLMHMSDGDMRAHKYEKINLVAGEDQIVAKLEILANKDFYKENSKGHEGTKSAVRLCEHPRGIMQAANTQ